MGTGSSGMVQSFSEDSAQNVIVVYFISTKTAGTEWKLTSGDGTVELTGNPAKEYSSLIVSSPDLKEGETYQLTAGEESMEITVSGRITQSGTRSGTGDAMPGKRGADGGGGERKPGEGQRPGGQKPEGGPKPEGEPQRETAPDQKE